jgi:hypothetical protein
MTSEIKQEKPKSYTQQLKDHLESNKCPKKYIDLISTFALEYSTKLEAEKEATKNMITFGKYKGKKFEDVYTLDKPYIKWMMKNNKYLSSANKQIVEDLLKAE